VRFRNLETRRARDQSPVCSTASGDTTPLGSNQVAVFALYWPRPSAAASNVPVLRPLSYILPRLSTASLHLSKISQLNFSTCLLLQATMRTRSSVLCRFGPTLITPPRYSQYGYREPIGRNIASRGSGGCSCLLIYRNFKSTKNCQLTV